jgi:hypothetical protein
MDRVRLCRISRGADTVTQTWQVGRHSNDESEEGPLVDPVPVVVSPVWVVQGRDVDMLFLDEPEVRGEDAGDGGKEDGVAAHKREEGLC